MRLPNGDSPDTMQQPVKTERLSHEKNEKHSVFSDPVALTFLVLRHWYIIAASLVLFLLLATAYLYFAPPVYRATAQFELLHDDRSETRKETLYERLERRLPRQLLLLNSSRLHEKTRRALRDEWSGRLTPGELYVDYTVGEVAQSSGTMVSIEVDSANHEYSEVYIRRMVEVYRELRQEELQEFNAKALVGLREEEKRVFNELEAARAELHRFETENAVFVVQERDAMDRAFFNQLLNRQKLVRMERTLLESQLETVQKSDLLTVEQAIAATDRTQKVANLENLRQPESVIERSEEADSGMMTSPAVLASTANSDTEDGLDRYMELEQLEGRLAELKQDYADWLKIRTEAHPEMERLSKEISQIEQTLSERRAFAVKRFEARYSALKLQENGIDAVLSKWRRDNSLPLAKELEHRRLNSQVNQLESKYNLVYRRLLENSDPGISFSLRYVQEPRGRMQPVAPQPVKILGATFVFSIGLGAGLIILREFFRPAMLDPDELEGLYNVNFLAGIPRWDLLLPKEDFDPDKDLFALHLGKNQVASETYRKLKFNITGETGKSEQLAFAVTSGRKGDGKTFNTANMALPFAWEGKKVLLIDADLRQAALTRRHAGEGVEHGLADWLNNCTEDPRKWIVPLEGQPLSLLPAGRFSETLPEQINQQAIQCLITELYKDYDVLIFDTAPVTLLTETHQVCRATDGAVVMVDSFSNRQDVKHCMHELRGTRILGFCLNSIDPKRVSESYGDGYYGNHWFGAYGYGENNSRSDA